MHYLLKTEPSTYSFGDLVKEKSTIWDGVTNPVALRNMREMKPGDKLIIYHTGEEKRAVGTATVEKVEEGDGKTPVVRIRAGSPVKNPLTLAELKANKLFKESPLARQPRLSVVPLSAEQYRVLVG